MNMYFIAIVAPEAINQHALKWKNFFKEHFQCIVALKSPAHITLVPPFWMKDDLEQDLMSCINEFGKSQTSFEITLKNFDAFRPKVIFIGVIKNQSLENLHASIVDFLCNENKFPIKKEDRPFHPHVTLAARDLYRKAFYEAWEIFSVKKYETAWTVNGISLLRHNKKNWDVIFTSQFED